MVLVYSEGRRRGRLTETLSRGSVQVRGQNVFYEASGSAEEGPTLLFLHESGGSGATWQAQLTGLAVQARAIAMDLPGHGRSEGQGADSIAGYRQAVLEFLDALAIRWPVVLAGVCLGAAVAVDVALHAPDRVHGLILAGVSDGGRACDRTLAAVARGEAPEAFVHGLFSSRAADRTVGEHAKRWRLSSPLVRHGDLMALATYDLPEALRQVHVPTLLVAGGEDQRATVQWAQTMAEEMSDACMIEVGQAGCLSMVEQPAVFNRMLLGFLNGLAPACPVTPEVKPGGYRRF